MNTSKSASKSARKGSISVCVSTKGKDRRNITGAFITIYTANDLDCDNFYADKWTPDKLKRIATKFTDDKGCATFSDLDPDCYIVFYGNYPKTSPLCVKVESGCVSDVCFEINLKVATDIHILDVNCKPTLCFEGRVGDTAVATFTCNGDANLPTGVSLLVSAPWVRDPNRENVYVLGLQTPGKHPLKYQLLFEPLDTSLEALSSQQISALSGTTLAPGSTAPLGRGVLTDEGGGVVTREKTLLPITGNIGVSMSRTETEPTEDLSLWTVIRNSTEALSFNNYLRFMDEFCALPPVSRFPNETDRYRDLKTKRFLPFTDTDAYRLLKAATEAFVMVNCGVVDPDDPSFSATLQKDASGYLDRRDIPSGDGDLKGNFRLYTEATGREPMLPYLALIRSKLPEIPIMEVGNEEASLCYGFVQEKLLSPCLIELIWSYWHEEGMLVQTMNAITRRFQNVHSLAAHDPLANMEIDPLRPLNNLIWGYTQDEQHRLTVVRRSYEYDHHYALRLEGKAVQNFRPVDTRSKFLEAFHHLLRLCTVFYKQDDDTTVKADAFPILNALKEVHLILSQGAHGQFNDLPATARIEMLMQQWLLARPEFREFLPTRLMVAYPEPWMDRVDAMKKLQGWTDTSVIHFRSLAMFGEQLLLSIRYGHWSDVYEPNQAFNWARFWRPQVQGYIHAYRAATGVELAGDTVDSGVDATLPSVLLQKRLAMQQRGA
jgi:hypothetical protein